MVCKWVCFVFRALPLPAWRTFLLDRHIDHCPRCRGEALADEAIRSLGVTPADLQNELRLFPPAAGRRLSRRRGLHSAWHYAFGFFLVAAVLGGAFAIWRSVSTDILPRGIVTVSEMEDDVRVFAVLAARINGEPARPVVFRPGQPGMTIVWFEKAEN